MATKWAAAAQEWKEGWPLVAAAAITQGVVITHFFTLGVFMKPLSELNGWSRADIAVLQIIQAVIFAPLAPFAATLADRFGPRRIALLGAAAYCATFALYAVTTREIWTWYAVGVLNGLAVLFCNAPILMLGVSRRFQASLGLALAVTLAGGSIYTTALLPILTAHVIELYGVKAAYLTLAVLGAALSLPMLFFFYDRSPPKADASPSNVDDAPGSDRPMPAGDSPIEVFRQARYWRVVLATVLITSAIHPAMIHFVPIATDSGIAFETAAAAASVMGIASIAGRLGTGLLLDTMPPRLVGAGCCLLPIVAFLLLAQGSGLPAIAAAAIAIGLSLGAEIDVVSYLTARYFGIRHYAVIYSVLYSVASLGSAGGVYLAGMIHDRSGSYSEAMLLCSAAACVAAVLFLSIGKAPTLDGTPRGEPQRNPGPGHSN